MQLDFSIPEAQEEAPAYQRSWADLCRGSGVLVLAMGRAKCVIIMEGIEALVLWLHNKLIFKSRFQFFETLLISPSAITEIPLHALLHCTGHWRCTKPLKKLEKGGGDDNNNHHHQALIIIAMFWYCVKYFAFSFFSPYINPMT